MKDKARLPGVSHKSFWNLVKKNLHLSIYFMILGLIIAVIYSSLGVTRTYEVTGSITKNSYITSETMRTIPIIAYEQETLETVAENVKPEEDKTSFANEIKTGLVVSTYNAVTGEIHIQYENESRALAIQIVDELAKVTIETFLERNPQLDSQSLIKDSELGFLVHTTGVPVYMIYIGLILLGGLYGVAIGIVIDLFNRRVHFDSDLEEYGLPYYTVNITRSNADEPLLINEQVQQETLQLFNHLEGEIGLEQLQVIGVSNLGRDDLNEVGNLLAKTATDAGAKVLLINLLSPNKNEEEKSPVIDMEGVETLNIDLGEMPARTLKEDAFDEEITSRQAAYEYIIINLQPFHHHASILLRKDLFDAFIVTTTFRKTKMKILDSYFNNLDETYKDKTFLLGFNDKVKKPNNKEQDVKS